MQIWFLIILSDRGFSGYFNVPFMIPKSEIYIIFNYKIFPEYSCCANIIHMCQQYS